MERKALIFDVDGTLSDSRATIIRAWDEVLDSLPYRHTELTMEFMNGHLGRNMDQWSMDTLPDLPLEESRKIINDCMQHENEMLYKIGASIYPDVRATFEKLKDRYLLYILSNCGCGYIEAISHLANVEDLIAGHLCFGDTGLDKPENIALLLRQEELKEAAYIGDMDGDRQSSEKAGVGFIYASYGFGHVNHPRYAIQKMSELPEVADRLFADWEKQSL